MQNSRPRLLIVEDERALGFLLAEVARENYEVCLTETARAALALFQTEAIDLVLTDHGLPDMAGDEFLTELAALKRGTQQRIPSILMTGLDPLDLPEAAWAVPGLAGVLKKPFDIRLLSVMLDAVLKHELDSLERVQFFYSHARMQRLTLCA